MLWPLDRVTGREGVAAKKAAFEKDTLVTVSVPEPVTVMVKGWEETLPLEPLKLSAVVERLMLLVAEC
jgi:hypothetical protein